MSVKKSVELFTYQTSPCASSHISATLGAYGDYRTIGGVTTVIGAHGQKQLSVPPEFFEGHRPKSKMLCSGVTINCLNKLATRMAKIYCDGLLLVHSANCSSNKVF